MELITDLEKVNGQQECKEAEVQLWATIDSAATFFFIFFRDENTFFIGINIGGVIMNWIGTVTAIIAAKVVTTVISFVITNTTWYRNWAIKFSTKWIEDSFK